MSSLSSNPNQSNQQEETIFEKNVRAFGGDVKQAQQYAQLDRAEEHVETKFQHSTSQSPAHRAVWECTHPQELFEFKLPSFNNGLAVKMNLCQKVIENHTEDRTVLGPDGKLSEELLSDLADVGYFGALIDPKYGGWGCRFSQFADFNFRVASKNPYVAGLSSVHGCIGAVDPISTYGNEFQKQKYLPKLASGEILSAFALTEPGAGSDLTAIKTKAVRDGDSLLITGEKIFITNATFGRTIGLVCNYEGEVAVVIVDLPKEESENFRFNNYGIYALKPLHNKGLIFNNFRVPIENLLETRGLEIPYHGLNRGRIALCANAGGTMAAMIADLIPWTKYRVTYNEEIGQRELVLSRLTDLACKVVTCKALTEWCANLLDKNYRGELECIIAKNIGAKFLKEAAIDDYMVTHGGRSFLVGHPFGDNVHDFLAPSIYEGEGEMLSMAYIKGLAKYHGLKLYAPISDAINDLKKKGVIKEFHNSNPKHLWYIKNQALKIMFWQMANKLKLDLTLGYIRTYQLADNFQEHADFAFRNLRFISKELDGAMFKHQIKLAERQLLINEISRRAQDLTTIGVLSFWGNNASDPILSIAADLQCQTLRMKLEGKHPTARYFKDIVGLGKEVAAGKFIYSQRLASSPILMQYK